MRRLLATTVGLAGLVSLFQTHSAQAGPDIPICVHAYVHGWTIHTAVVTVTVHSRGASVCLY